MPIRAAVAAVIVTVAVGRAGAQPYRPVYAPPPSPPPSQVAPESDGKVFLYGALHAGLNLPLGALGGELGIGLDRVRGAVSMGHGLRGPSVAAMLRVVHHVRGVDLALGVGVSRGPGMYEVRWVGDEDIDPGDNYDVHFADGTRWLDLEVSGEVLITRNSFVRWTVGATRAFHITCVAVERGVGAEGPCDAGQFAELEDAGFRPYFGAAVGFRFPAAPSSSPRLGAFARPFP